ncbi:unnamed protein product [Linum trigynum]|uniref:Uncharacterized protein n=1 Tax=Linum trigynum TaxID=586398 RepID=A0AAV2CTF1_9ROSI
MSCRSVADAAFDKGDDDRPTGIPLGALEPSNRRCRFIHHSPLFVIRLGVKQVRENESHSATSIVETPTTANARLAPTPIFRSGRGLRGTGLRPHIVSRSATAFSNLLHRELHSSPERLRSS